ncbi:hypothetical protein E5288_WYG014103 [Bos mutus]|uniref:Uncharacterized protein n=1 Tax=Bos mutus TaxID=72004 RepID=A0A6B0S3M4_9CETA|nr:hypothetical protein [Bos mutus]
MLFALIKPEIFAILWTQTIEDRGVDTMLRLSLTAMTCPASKGPAVLPSAKARMLLKPFDAQPPRRDGAVLPGQDSDPLARGWKSGLWVGRSEESNTNLSDAIRVRSYKTQWDGKETERYYYLGETSTVVDVEQILGKARCSSWQRSKVLGIKCLCIARTRFGEENGNHVRAGKVIRMRKELTESIFFIIAIVFDVIITIFILTLTFVSIAVAVSFKGTLNRMLWFERTVLDAMTGSI